MCISIYLHVYASILIIVIKLANIYKRMFYVPGTVWSVMQPLTHLIVKHYKESWVPLLSSFYMWGNWGIERLSDFSNK